MSPNRPIFGFSLTLSLIPHSFGFCIEYNEHDLPSSIIGQLVRICGETQLVVLGMLPRREVCKPDLLDLQAESSEKRDERESF